MDEDTEQRVVLLDPTKHTKLFNAMSESTDRNPLRATFVLSELGGKDSHSNGIEDVRQEGRYRTKAIVERSHLTGADKVIV
jgi:hypothetical protein